MATSTTTAMAVKQSQQTRNNNSSNDMPGIHLERKSYTVRRRSISRGGTHPTLSNVNGYLQQINTIDQFHPAFCNAIKQFQTPRAICGYISMANALICQQFVSTLPGRRISSRDQLAALELKLRDVSTVMESTAQFMKILMGHRKRYIRKHPKDFKTRYEKQSYMEAWVANYEISDILATRAKARDSLDGLVFLRFNQSSEAASATHEERQRILQDEMPYASAHRQGCDKGADFRPGDVVFFAECFSRKKGSHLLVPEAAVEFNEQRKVFPTAFVIDLNSHFCAAVPATIDGENVLFVFNTTIANYLNGSGAIASAMAFDVSFPPGGHPRDVPEVVDMTSDL